MATEIQKQVLQLYVGILGRGVNGNADVDQEGFEYWVSEIEAGNLSIADARRNFIEEQPEGQALYSGDTASVINGLYQNLFGRDAEAEGLAYWQEAVDNGTLDFAQVAEALVAGAQSSDVDTINSRVDAQAAVVGADETVDTSGLTAALNNLAAEQEARVDFLENAYETVEKVEAEADNIKAGQEPTADELDTAVGNVRDAAITAVNNGTDAAVGDISKDRTDAYNNAIIDEQKTVNQSAVTKASEKVAETDGLAAAVKGLQSAQAGVEAAIDAQLDTNVDVKGAETAFETADNGANAGTITLQYGSVTAGAFATGVVNATDLSANDVLVVDNNTDAVIEVDSDGNIVVAAAYEGEAQAANLLNAVKADVSAIQSLVSARGTLEDSIAEILVLEGANEITTEGLSALTDNNASTIAAVDTTGDLYTKNGVTYVGVDSAGGTASETVDFYAVSDFTVNIAADGTLTYDAVIDSTNADDTQSYDGLNSTVADAFTNGGYTTVSANDPLSFTSANVDASAFVDTATDSYLLENAGVNDFQSNAPDSFGLISAEATQSDFNEAVEDYMAAKALADQLEGLNDGVTEAREAIENAEEDGGLGINLREGTESFTVEDDVYLFSEESGNLSLAKFGDNGADKIFFGEGFSLVQIPDGDTITDNVGDVAASEILWDQQGNDLVLYVESETFAGNASTQTDMVEITLTGVSAEDVSFADGYLSAGTAA